jgi:hypothetical protein
MSGQNRDGHFNDLEAIILRVASVIFLLLMILKFLKYEITSW